MDSRSRASGTRGDRRPPARFIEELEALGGHGERTEGLEEAREYVLDLAQEAELLVRWDVEYLEELGADEPLRKPASRSLSGASRLTSGR